MAKWTEEEIAFLKESYPTLGKMACARHLGRSEASVRWEASQLGLRLDLSSRFCKDAVARRAATMTGRKRPEHARIMREHFQTGRMRRTEEERRNAASRLILWRQTHAHPRGALGLKHSQETKATISGKSRRMWAEMTPDAFRQRSAKALRTRAANGTRAPDRIRGTWKAAWREIGGTRAFYRSRWEANYARYLEWMKEAGGIVAWEHEPESFVLDDGQNGVVGYLPDFRVHLPNGSTEYHEVKGWMDARSAEKIHRMRECHPEVTLVVVDANRYREIERDVKGIVPDWERSR